MDDKTGEIQIWPTYELICRENNWEPSDPDTEEAMLAEQGGRITSFSVGVDETFEIESGWEGWTVEPEDGSHRVRVISLDGAPPDVDCDYKMPAGRYLFDGTDVKQIELFCDDEGGEE